MHSVTWGVKQHGIIECKEYVRGDLLRACVPTGLQFLTHRTQIHGPGDDGGILGDPAFYGVYGGVEHGAVEGVSHEACDEGSESPRERLSGEGLDVCPQGGATKGI